MSVIEIDDNTLHAIASKLNSLTQQYTNGQLKHMNYVDQYDKVLEQYRITKRDLVGAIAKRNSAQTEDEIKLNPPPANKYRKPLL